MAVLIAAASPVKRVATFCTALKGRKSYAQHATMTEVVDY